jgi:ATP-binding cassette, subfamily C (CFTR/MRP), member 1
MSDFCLDGQGWGPISSVKYAFTPCFQDGILSILPTILLIVAGSAQAWQYLQHPRISNARNYTYVAKILTVFMIFLTNLVLTVIRWRESLEWQKDVLVWSALLKTFGLAFAISLHDLEYIRYDSPVPSGVLLFYWSFTILFDAIKLYSFIGDDIQQQLVYFVVFTIGFGGEVVIFLLEYLLPKGNKEYSRLQQEEEEDGAEPCPADFADIFSRYNSVSSHANTVLSSTG